MKEVIKINKLEHLKLLSDPMKLDLLQAFAEAETTIGEVAESLGQPVTRLYRHVDALQEAGLIEVTQERKKRGTVERHFRAAAKRFEVDQSLFSGVADDESSAVRDMLRSTEDELIRAIGSMQGDDETTTFVKIRIKASPERIEQLQASLMEWIETVQEDTDESGEEELDFGALLAFYPLKPG